MLSATHHLLSVHKPTDSLQPSDTSPLHIQRYEWHSVDPDWQQRPWLWGGIVARGVVHLQPQLGEAIVITPGSAYLVAPDTMVALSSPSDAVVEWRLLSQADQAPLSAIAAATGPDMWPQPVRLLRALPPDQCERWSYYMTSAWQATAFWWQLASYQVDALAMLVELRPPPLWLRQAITACASGNGLRRGVSGLALAGRRSPSMLRRTVRTCYGCSATELMQHLRLDRARYLLRHTDDTLSDIASYLGWRSVTYFSQCFTKHHGQPPGAWRRKMR